MNLLGWILMLVGLAILVVEFVQAGDVSLVGAGVAVVGAAIVFGAGKPGR